MNDVPIAALLAQWSASFSLDDAPEAARLEALRSLLDVVGVSIAGATHETCGRMRALAEAEHGAGPCTILGSTRRLSASAAALVNGTAAHVLDFDDVSYEGMVHATAVVWPAVLAAAESIDASGRATLEALIVGIEVDCALGRAFTHDLFWRGFWTTGLLGAIGAAAGVAKVLGLDPAASEAAIGIAATQASGLRAIVGTGMKPVACGLAAETGLRAVLLARAGIRGPADPIGHRQGFAALLNGGVFRREEIERLGERFVLAQSPMAFKRYPICSYGQAAVEASLAALAESAAPARRVVCEVQAGILDNMPYGRPATPTEAQFSLTFALGAALAFGGLTPPHLTAAMLTDARLAEAMARVEIRVATGDAATALDGATEGAVVNLEDADGQRITRVVRVPIGMPDRPISDAQLAAKFRGCVEPVIGAAAASPLLARVLGIASLAQIRDLMR